MNDRLKRVGGARAPRFRPLRTLLTAVGIRQTKEAVLAKAPSGRVIPVGGAHDVIYLVIQEACRLA